MEDTKKSWTIYRVYLLIATLFGLIGGLISLGIALTALGQRLIITDQEYIVGGHRSYELQQCKEPYYYGKTSPTNENRRPSEEQIKECETEKKEYLLLGRNSDFKLKTIGGIIWAILFSILFLTHYPRFKLSQKDDK